MEAITHEPVEKSFKEATMDELVEQSYVVHEALENAGNRLACYFDIIVDPSYPPYFLQNRLLTKGYRDSDYYSETPLDSRGPRVTGAKLVVLVWRGLKLPAKLKEIRDADIAMRRMIAMKALEVEEKRVAETGYNDPAEFRESALFILNHSKGMASGYVAMDMDVFFESVTSGYSLQDVTYPAFESEKTFTLDLNLEITFIDTTQAHGLATLEFIANPAHQSSVRLGRLFATMTDRSLSNLDDFIQESITAWKKEMK